MPKKITENIERWCCQNDDLEPIKEKGRLHGKSHRLVPWPFMKCRHCGQLYEYYRFMDAAGSTDWDYRPVIKPKCQNR